MLQEMVFAGFGGQGVLSLGTILAYAAMKDGLEVTWFPSYGPEMRGGTANCMVNVSDREISSPIVTDYDLAMVFNLPSLRKFEEKVKPGGTLIWESSIIKDPPTRTDVTTYALPAIRVATEELKNIKVMNMVALGALSTVSDVVKQETILQALKDTLPKRYAHLLPLNERAFNRGLTLLQKQ